MNIHTEESNQSPKLSNPKKSRVRSKTGCFTCRFRKKKCDERKSICKNCDRNSLSCIWPQHSNETLPKNFKLSGNSFDFVINTTVSDIDANNTPHNKEYITIHPSPEDEYSIANFSPILANSVSQSSTPSVLSPGSELGLFPFDVIEHQNIEISPIFGFNWIPNYKLSKEDAFLYHLFTTQFIPSISPSHSHHLLTPKATFIPQGLQSNILLKIFFACGATILAYNKPEYRELAHTKYLECIKLIQHVIMNNEVEGTEDWLFVSIQTLCLRERAFGANASRCAKHLTASYNIIKKRLESQLSSQPYEDINITPIEKCLLESFIFNYSITILMCKIEDLKLLPNPFEFFKIYNPLLAKPIYSDCLVPWMNNPVMGAAFQGFEIAAKTSFLFRNITQLESPTLTSNKNFPYPELSVSESNLALIKNLQLELSHFKPSALPEDAIESPYHTVLTANIAISKIIIIASSVLLMKLLDSNLSPSSFEIQSKLKLVIDELRLLPNDDHSSCLTIWSILVMGTSAINTADQIFLRDKLKEIGELMHANAAIQVVSFLEKCWENEDEDEMFGMIFDRSNLELISA